MQRAPITKVGTTSVPVMVFMVLALGIAFLGVVVFIVLGDIWLASHL